MKLTEKGYLAGLTLRRKLEYLQATWGAHPSFAIDLAKQPDGTLVVVGSAMVLNAVLAAELNHPSPAIRARSVTDGLGLDEFVTELLLLWERRVVEALEDSAT